MFRSSYTLGHDIRWELFLFSSCFNCYFPLIIFIPCLVPVSWGWVSPCTSQGKKYSSITGTSIVEKCDHKLIMSQHVFNRSSWLMGEWEILTFRLLVHAMFQPWGNPQQCRTGKSTCHIWVMSHINSSWRVIPVWLLLNNIVVNVTGNVIVSLLCIDDLTIFVFFF